MKRVLILIAGAIVLIGLLVGAYFLFFANGNSGLTATPGGSFGSADDRAGGLGAVVDTGVPVQGAGTQVAPRLLQLSEVPVAKGSFSFYTPAQTTTASSSASGTPETIVTVPEETEVRYIDRQSGNVYSFRIHERVMTRLSNKTLPGIEEANWSLDGSRAFVRFLEDVGDGQERISTFMLPANGEGGYFLEQDIEQVLVASTSIVMRTESTGGSSIAAASIDGTGARALFSSSLRAIRLAFFGSTNFIATTKASASLDGYSFSIDRAGSFTRLLGPLAGLTTLASPDANRLLYTYSDRGRLVTQVLSLTDRTSVPLPLATLPEKCVWSRDSATLYCGVPTALTGALPDEWYQGVRPFSDRIWKIDLATRVATLVFDPVQLADTQIDAISLTIDSANDVLIFMNKTDGSLWSYDL